MLGANGRARPAAKAVYGESGVIIERRRSPRDTSDAADVAPADICLPRICRAGLRLLVSAEPMASNFVFCSSLSLP